MKRCLLILLSIVSLVACDRSSGGRGGGSAAVGPAGPPGPAGATGPRGLPGRAADPGGVVLPQGIFDVTTFGALGDGTADDSGAIQQAIEAADDIGGGVIWFPPGVYAIGAALEVGGRDFITFRGSGIDATVLSSTSPTEPIFDSDFEASWRLWEDMTLTSAVTKTSGALMDFARERRSTLRRLKITGFFDGIHLDSFEVMILDSIQLTNPSGPGVAMTIGKLADAPQGANLTINNSFFRGTDGRDGVGENVTGMDGIIIYDADAVFMFNNDLAGYRRSTLRIEPRTRSFNHHFLQNYFDATQEGPNIDVGGPGGKAQITFTGNWIASAGQMAGGSPSKVTTAIGMRVRNEGSYGAWNITGGRVFNTLGRGIEILAESIPLGISGVQFENFGIGRVPNFDEGLVVNTGFNRESAHVAGCTFFQGSGGEDVETGPGATLFSISATRGNGRILCGARPVLAAANAFLGGSIGCN